MRILAWMVAASVLAGSMAAAQEVPARQMTVTGEGRVAVAPDMATLRLGAAAEARQAAEALSRTSEITQRIIDRLAAAGIGARDIQTSGLSLSPLRRDRGGSESQEPGISGYAARNAVTVRLRDLDRLGAVLDEVVSDGANTLDSLNFGLQDPRPVMDEARRQAVEEARARAELYAEAAGVRLGAILSLSEGGGSGPGPMFAEMSMARSDVPVAAGEIEVTAQVTVVYAIGD